MKGTISIIAACLLAAAQSPEHKPAAAAPKPEAEPAAAARGADLNLLGQVNAARGESRRNENVPFNLIDNNALKEANIRLGATATLIESFRAEQSYFGSEFGTAMQAALHLPAARPNPYHGDFFWAHGNSVFNARRFFQAGPVQPAHDNNYGFQVSTLLWNGGALTGNASQNKIRGNVNGNVLVPRLDERTPLTGDPAARALITRFMAAYPAEAPNRTDIDLRALNTNSPQVIDEDNVQLRLDQNIGSNDRISARHTYTAQVVDAFQFVAGQNPDTTTRSHSSRLTWTRTWSGGLISEVSAGFDRVRSLLVPEPNHVGPFVLFGRVIEQLGPNEGIPIDRAENRYRAAAGFRLLAAKHSFTFGGGLLRRQLNGREENSHRGLYFFGNDFGRDAITNFRMGRSTRYMLAAGDIHRGFRSWNANLYFDDTWQVRPGVSILFGVRHQPSFAPYEVNHLSAIPYGCDCNNFAPRVGLTIQPQRGLIGIFRLNYGVQFGEIFPVTYQQVRFNPPQNLTIVIAEPDLVNPLRGLVKEDLDANGRTSIRQLDDGLKVPYSHQYNFIWELPAIGGWRMQLGYAGSRTHKLFLLSYRNRGLPTPGIAQTSATVNLRRRDPRYFDVYQLHNGSRAYYDAARVAMFSPRWRGLAAEISYWFSKAIDLGSDYTNTGYEKDGRLSRAQSELDQHGDMKGLSTFDQTHAFLMRLSFETPTAGPGAWKKLFSRWNFGSVALWKSGTPFEVQSGSDGLGVGNLDGQNGDRVHIIDPRIRGRTIGDPDTSTRFMPRAAFSFMGEGEQRGSIGHHIFRKGTIANVNMSAARTISLGGDRTVQFRAESINLFNTPQFAEPSIDLIAPSFGKITNTLNDGRTFRFTMRFGF